MAQISDENDDADISKHIAEKMHSKATRGRLAAGSPRGINAAGASLQFLAMLTWALWFGGLITLFLAVQALFSSRRSIAGDAASAIFIAFEHYQLAVAGFLLIFTALLYGLRPSWPLVIAFFLFAFASIFAVYSAMLVTPYMETLREQYLTHTSQFAHLHVFSMILFVGEAIFLLVGGVLLPHRRNP